MELITGRDRLGITSATMALATAHSPPPPWLQENEGQPCAKLLWPRLLVM